MNYCVYLKKRKNKPFCKLIYEEITLSRCWECDKKEYKKRTKFSKNSAKTYCKNDEKHNYCANLSNNYQIRQSPLSKEKSSHRGGKMKNKSNKLAKLERNRFSVFTNNKDECFICKSTYQLTWHEIFAGRNRRNSMEDGFCLRLCLHCHEKKQEDIYFNDFWHKKAQMYYEEFIGSREQFLSRYRKNYLD